MHLRHRTTCRICGSRSLTPVIDLGDQYLQGSFVKAGEDTPPYRKVPCRLVRCDPSIDEKACGLLQMAHSVPPEILYSSYWYRSGTNETMRRHLKEVVETALSMSIHKTGTALDIGCNDGTLLTAYPDEWKLFGIDPSDIAQEVKGEVTVFQDTFPSNLLRRNLGGQRFEIITSIAMFYDLEDPVSFVSEIHSLLSQNGLWIVEMSYMPTMLEMNSYDTICHEHLEYYSLSVLENLFHSCGLKIVRADLNAINGGSLRCYVTHESCDEYHQTDWICAIRELRRQEFDHELDTDKPYKAFQDRINLHREELVSLIKQLRRDGKKIHIYGASTKGNTILQWCNLDCRVIQCAAERNPDKYGAMTLGTDIPIVSEDHSRAMLPDYYLVLPWHFKDEFLEREKPTLEKGVGFIFPLPRIEVVGRPNTASE
jgi:hypothetical protein